VSKIGWDELLKSRSAVFVMEEEYRMQKAQADIQQHFSADGHADEGGYNGLPNVGAGSMDGALVAPVGRRKGEADDDASTRAVVSPPHDRATSVAGSDVPGPDVPTIVISAEADGQKEEVDAATAANGDAKESQQVSAGGERGEMDTLEKPVQSAVRDEKQELSTANSPQVQETFSFSNKRLCERWLDNLFMVLYEVGFTFSSRSRSCLNNNGRTCAYGQFSERKSRISRRSVWLIARRRWSGRSWEISDFGYTIRKTPRNRTNGVSTRRATRTNRGQS
jgi:hypothetical protein